MQHEGPLIDLSTDDSVLRKRPGDNSTQHSQATLTGSELERVKQELQGWREVLVPLNSVLNWEQQYYPALLAAVTSFIFLLIWFFDPSVLTTLGLLGFTLSLLDFVIPLVGSYVFGAKEWTEQDERQFESVCVRLLNCRTHLMKAWNQLNALKNTKPKLYLTALMGGFALLAWIGSMIDNLLLLYLIVLFLVLLPGLRQRGLLQQAWHTLSSQTQRYWSQPSAKTKKH